MPEISTHSNHSDPVRVAFTRLTANLPLTEHVSIVDDEHGPRLDVEKQSEYPDAVKAATAAYPNIRVTMREFPLVTAANDAPAAVQQLDLRELWHHLNVRALVVREDEYPEAAHAEDVHAKASRKMSGAQRARYDSHKFRQALFQMADGRTRAEVGNKCAIELDFDLVGERPDFIIGEIGQIIGGLWLTLPSLSSRPAEGLWSFRGVGVADAVIPMADYAPTLRYIFEAEPRLRVVRRLIDPASFKTGQLWFFPSWHEATNQAIQAAYFWNLIDLEGWRDEALREAKKRVETLRPTVYASDARIRVEVALFARAVEAAKFDGSEYGDWRDVAMAAKSFGRRLGAECAFFEWWSDWSRRNWNGSAQKVTYDDFWKGLAA